MPVDGAEDDGLLHLVHSLRIADSFLTEQSAVACQVGVSVGGGGPDAQSAHFLLFGEGLQGQSTFVCRPHDGLGDGVVAVLFHRGHQFEQSFLGKRGGVDFAHFKFPFRQRTGLVENHRVNPGDGIQVVPSLEQDTLSGGCTDTSEIAQRDAHHQGTGAGDDQEHQSAIEPVVEHIREAGGKEIIYIR